MKIKKHDIIYNLDIYAKTYISDNNLCLADVQGDYDKIDFENEHSVDAAFKAISKAYDEGFTFINFDEIDRQVQEETNRDNAHLDGFNLRFRINPDDHMEQVSEPTPEIDEAEEPQEPERGALNSEPSLQPWPEEHEEAAGEGLDLVASEGNDEWGFVNSDDNAVIATPPSDLYTSLRNELRNEVGTRLAELRVDTEILRMQLTRLQNEVHSHNEDSQDEDIRREILERCRSNTHDEVRMPEAGEAERENEILRRILANREE